MYELSPDQNTCLDQIMSWWTDSKESLYTLGGFAGTGKSYLISVLRTKLENIKVAFCCYTGKATSVLNNKLKHNNSLRSSDKCSTIHSLIYTPDVDKNGDVIGWKLRDNLDDYDLLILDEASMVSEDVFCDLESFGIPILAVGDHGQLPPVGGNLNLMKDPQSKLE